ncbi:MAG: IS5 family transposase [Methylococcaceae bacterium]|nr:IS5 family transposase [Methylococcaceae bacterium]MDP2395059.1 IS5 family transposase [Methylococcaceae bacterium]MDP3934138.1 IS5 family transposase [Methylococcaceae bacterium]MDZ4219047.1 IS5 family transposase [Methylobacter sp.]
MIKESLFAAEEREAKLNKLGDTLQLLEKHVDFAALAAAIDQAAPRPSLERGGRRPFPTELMVRALIIQQLYNLSDEQMEYQLLDRLSFQRFVGLRHSSQIPDRTTFWTFRERLNAAGASETLFDAVNRELDKHGYIARGGQMIDASIVPAPKQHLHKAEKDLVKQAATPIDWSPAKRRQKDVDATWTKKHGKSYFGYKLSACADKRYKLIRKIKISTASEHDTRHFEDVLDPSNTSRDIYADKGYVDSDRESRLKTNHWRVHIQRKAAPGKPLSDCQKRRNTRIAKTRARVEHVFAGIEQLGGKGLRCIGLERATLQLNWKAASYNLRRLCSLKTCGIVAF